MEGSWDSTTDECSITSSQKLEEDRNQGKENIYEYKHKDGGSSSNSTVEENENKPSVRPYVRSKMPRLRWTPDLHLRFIHAVERLGGQNSATPKLVLQLMNIEGLNIAHVKSHLQMYRSKKIDDPSQGVVDQMHILEGADQNLYNLSQFPTLSGFNRSHKSSFRYGDASWERLEDLLQFSAMGQSFKKMRPEFYDAFMGRNSVSGNNNLFSSGLLNSNLRSSSSLWQDNELQREILQPLPQKESLEGHEYKSSKLMQSQVQELSSSKESNSLERGRSSTRRLEKLAGAKGKTAHCNTNMQLSLSLGLIVGKSSGGCQEQEGLDDEEDDSQLSLSLWSSRCSSKQRRLIGDSSSGNGRDASTLDLTL